MGAGVAVIIFIEVYTSWKTRLPARKTLSPITQDSLDNFETTAKATSRRTVDEESTSYGSSGRGAHRTRGSMASVLEMMSLTLAVMPSTNTYRGPVPLRGFFDSSDHILFSSCFHSQIPKLWMT